MQPETTDPEVIVAEFEYQGTVEPFALAGILVIRVRAARIRGRSLPGS
jgi:hypothetical protein